MDISQWPHFIRTVCMCSFAVCLLSASFNLHSKSIPYWELTNKCRWKETNIFGICGGAAVFFNTLPPFPFPQWELWMCHFSKTVNALCVIVGVMKVRVKEEQFKLCHCIDSKSNTMAAVSDWLDIHVMRITKCSYERRQEHVDRQSVKLLRRIHLSS